MIRKAVALMRCAWSGHLIYSEAWIDRDTGETFVREFPCERCGVERYRASLEGESVEDFVAETERRRVALRKRLGEADSE